MTFEEKYMLFKDDIIGKGTFSTIYKGKSRITNEIVAIKHIDITNISSETKQLIINEVKLLQNYKHPNIIECIDTFVSKNYINIILKYYELGDLSIYLKTNILTEKEVQIIFRQLIDAIKYLRNNNIMHRDIKPSNILLESKSKIILCDFGLAKKYNNTKDLSSTICGSPLYMAPELLTQKYYTPNCDIWSIGVVLYEMLFNKRPISANSIETLKEKLKENVLIPKNISIDCYDLISRLLVKDLKKRITWKELFCHVWIVENKKKCNERIDLQYVKGENIKIFDHLNNNYLYEIESFELSDELPSDESDLFVVDDLYI